MSVTLSFCIPVYNNAAAALEIVKSLLRSDDKRFEIVVCDDCSSDDAEKLLSSIHDERFRYFRNEKNLGAHKNWERSLELGRGKWLYLVMGRDKMNGDNAAFLVDNLMKAGEKNITFIRDSGHRREGFKIYEGIDAIISFINYSHPTGCVFRADLFRAIPERSRYFENADMYPELYVIRDLLIQGKGAYFHSGIICSGFVTDKAKVKSTVDKNRDINKTYFAPERRTLQFFEQLDMIEKDLAGKFTKSELDKFFEARYLSLLDHVSYRWRTWCRDPVQMAHYGHEVKNVSLSEMINCMLKAQKDTASHLKDNGTFSGEREKIMRSCTAKLIIKLTVKSMIRAVIEPLGIWKILHFFRNY